MGRNTAKEDAILEIIGLLPRSSDIFISEETVDTDPTREKDQEVVRSKDLKNQAMEAFRVNFLERVDREAGGIFFKL